MRICKICSHDYDSHYYIVQSHLWTQRIFFEEHEKLFKSVRMTSTQLGDQSIFSSLELQLKKTH